MMRNRIYQIHLFMGLFLGLIVSFVGLTGSAVVFKPEIDRWLNPELYNAPVSSQRIPVERVADYASAAYRWGDPSFMIIHFPLRPGDVYRVLMKEGFQEDSGPWLQAMIDPSSGELLGAHNPEQTLGGALIALHVHLFTGEHHWGGKLVGLTGVVLLAFCMTGIYLWWPGLQKLASGFKIKWQGSTRRTSYDLHRVGGIVMTIPLLLLVLTGVVLAFPGYVRPAFNLIVQPEHPPQAPQSKPIEGARRISLDRALESATRVWPEAQVTSITLPGGPRGVFTVRKRFPGDPYQHYNNGRGRLWIDQYNGEVLAHHDMRNMPVGSRLLFDWIFPTHTGEIGGTGGRIAAFLAGLSPTFLFATGILVWYLRRRRSR